MNSMSDSMISALEKFKDRDADDVFNLIFATLNEGNLGDDLTPAEQALSECIKNDAEYFEKFHHYNEKFITFVKQLGKIEDLALLEPQDEVIEQLHKTILFLYCDLSELLSRKSFAYGVAYGKMLATTR